MSIFKNKYEKEVEEARNNSIKDDTYYLMGSKKALELAKKPNSNVEIIYELYKDWDSESQIPLEIGNEIESMINDPNYIFGIHRTYVFQEDIINSNLVQSVFHEGLINNGDLSSGAYSSCPSPSKTISFIDNMLNACILLKSSYKNSNIAIICLFPQKYFDKNKNILEEHINDIYDFIDGIPHIKTDYILGFLIQGERLEYVRKEDIIKERNR